MNDYEYNDQFEDQLALLEPVLDVDPYIYLEYDLEYMQGEMI